MAYLPELLGNGAIILGITVLTSVWDLSNRGRRFPWVPVVFSAPFLALVFIQCCIVGAFLASLVASGRAHLSSYVDAAWVSLAGISLLKTLPAPKHGDSQRLWGLADWLFKELYRQIQIIIIAESERFKRELRQQYSRPSELWERTEVFINFNETPESAAGEIARMKAGFDGLAGDSERIEFLVNYLGPRTTRGEWRKLSSS